MRKFDTLEEMVDFAREARDNMRILEQDDPVMLLQRVYKLWWHWADLTIFIVHPTIPVIFPPVIWLPEEISGTTEQEFVYPIHDHGYKLCTSKAEEMFTAGDSMCKLFYTIEKMVTLLIDRLESSGETGTDMETEVQVAFAGHELSQRKAFESIINLKQNVVVTNFEPGSWGDRYLETIKKLADRGYGYPPEAPRDNYRLGYRQASVKSVR